MPDNIKWRPKSGFAFDLFNYFGFLVFSIIVLFPFWDTFLLSFSDPATATSLGFNIWIKSWSLSSYSFILKDGRIGVAYYNTLFRTIVTTGFSLTTTMLAAYPLSKRDLPGRNLLTIFFLITMFFSGGLIPSYMLIRNLGLMNTRWALILPGIFSAYNMIIMRNYLMSLDVALEEAAFIEGAGYGTILRKIIIPLSKPILATVALWTAVSNWNAWFDCMIYCTDKSLVVLQLLLRRMVQDSSADANSLAFFNATNEKQIASVTVKAATLILTIGPIVALYPFLQRYFVKGIMIGSLKG